MHQNAGVQARELVLDGSPTVRKNLRVEFLEQRTHSPVHLKGVGAVLADLRQRKREEVSRTTLPGPRYANEVTPWNALGSTESATLPLAYLLSA
jgi:hypothetical protein